MAVVVTGTGPFVNDSVSGISASHPFATFDYFSGLVAVSAATYAATGAVDPTILDFGSIMKELVLMNAGSGTIAFQWKQSWGKATDSGLLLPNSTVTLRNVIKSGMKVRSADGAASTLYVWGF